MTLQEIFDRVLIESGQFQLGKDKIELNLDNFKKLTDHVLDIYSSYNPRVVWLYLQINTTRQFTFDDSNTVSGIPVNVIALTPVRISGVVPYYLREYDRPRSNLDVKVEFPWVYRNPTLTVPTSAEYDAQCTYNHELVNTSNDPLNPQWECTTLEGYPDEFFYILAGKFMQIIGMNRRSFTMSELPLTSDAADLVREGKEKEKEGMQDLIDNKSRWYLAWGG